MAQPKGPLDGVQGMVFALGSLIMIWILFTDLIYAVLDPRIRYE